MATLLGSLSAAASSVAPPGRRTGVVGFRGASAIASSTGGMGAKVGGGGEKLVWVWTESKQVMNAAVERGWSTFIFPGDQRALSDEWSFGEASTRRWGDAHVVINLQEGWQVIPAENIVAAFQGSSKAVLAIASSSNEAQVFLEALEQGLGGVVLKVEEVHQILKLKEYFDRALEVKNALRLSKATVTEIRAVGMGDRVCVDLCSIMLPGEGLLVGSFARGLFLVHSECLESNYIASRPFRVNAGPVHAYVAVPGGKTCYLSELHAGMEVIVVDQRGSQRVAIVGRVKVESRPLILVQAKEDPDDGHSYGIFLQNAETVGLVPPHEDEHCGTAIPVTSLKVGDSVLLRMQGGARHTGIEIQEFILEK